MPAPSPGRGPGVPGTVPPFSIGGQAVLEGVMMRSPSAVATAVRRADGEIVVTHRPFRSVSARWRLLRLPILRGGVNLIEALVLGMQALGWSAEQAMPEADGAGGAPAGPKAGRRAGSCRECEAGEGPSRERAAAEPPPLGAATVAEVPGAAPAPPRELPMSPSSWKSKLGTAAMLVVAFAAGLGLFFYLPLFITGRIGVRGGVAFNLVDGAFRLLFFLAYLWVISLWKEMRRVFQYHGAEHKSIFVFENGLPLEPLETRRFSTLHPRCGTSFLLLVMLVSIVVFTGLGRPESVGERLLRLAFVPVIGGIAYELIKLSGKPAGQRWMKPIILPGLWLQKITTKEPTLDQVEVAMAAVRACLEYETAAAEVPVPALQGVPA